MSPSAHYHKGIDCFLSSIKEDARTDISCRACSVRIIGQKAFGPTSWASAMASIKTEHWQYLCPNSMKEGHKELVALLREMEDLVSERLKRIVEEELMEKRRAFLKGIRSVEAKKKA